MAERVPGDPDDEARWRGASYALIGREAELAALRDAVTRGARVATLLGVAGSGKTSLLTAVASALTAEGWDVVRLRGRPTEAMLGSATLLDLVEGYETADRELTELRDSLRARLLGQGADGGPEPLRLRRDLHRWLVGAADRPLLVVVDDAQWVDKTSWRVLAFLGSRLAESQVSLLLASRADRQLEGLEDLPVVEVAPLGPDDAMALLATAAPVMDPIAQAEVLERAAGNPLALVELARVSGIAGAASRGTGPASVPAAVEAAFASDLRALPAATQAALLLAAAGGDELPVLAAALAAPSAGGGPDAPAVAEVLAPAEAAGLARVSAGRVVFRHPLVQSTVYDLAGVVRRREVHATLAGVYAEDDDRRVWHRAAATSGPDDAVAEQLLASAARMRQRGAYRESAAALLRAAELTSDPATRDQRSLDAAVESASVGHVHRAATLAEHFRRTSRSPLVRARAAQVHAYALAQTMQQASAYDMLQVAVEELLKLDEVAGWSSLTTLASLSYQTCQRGALLLEWLERYEALTDHQIETAPLNAAAHAWVRVASDPLARPAGVRQVVRTAPDHPPGEDAAFARAAYDMLLGAAAWLLDEHPIALARLERANEVMQRTGATQMLPQSVMALGQAQFDTGRYDDADWSGRLLVDLSETHGLAYYRAAGRELRARVAAVRGEPGAAEQVDALLAAVPPGQAVALEANLLVGRALAAHAEGDHEGAYQLFRSLFDAEGRARHPHVSHRALGQLVAAAVRVGRAGEVTDIVARAEQQLADLPGQRLTRILARAKAQLAEDAGPLFERAVHETGADTWPFEAASAELEYAVWLRRQHRAADARTHLHSARRVFARLGARPWVELATAELRAAGVRVEERETRWGDLTAQEREIVLLAATGLTNKEIGQRLFLSPRTVGAHLYHAFPKLGVASRTQLRDLVGELRD